MLLVDRPTMAPGHCIVSMTSEDPGGFIDTGLSPALIDPRVYVSRQAVIDMGRKFGFPTPDEVDELVDKLNLLKVANADLSERLEEADRFAEAAEYTLKATFGQDTKIRNKPGRKPVVR